MHKVPFPIQKEILIKARAKIENPDNWLTGLTAMDSSGNSVFASDPKACKWCLGGAVESLIPERDPSGVLYSGRQYLAALDRLALKHHNKSTFVLVNDDIGHEAALKLLDLLIEETPK
jgi:hypothetical protein